MRNVVNTAADFVCDLWQNYSEFTTSWADPTGVGKFNNAVFSRLCTPRDKRPPNPPSVQFLGGQCDKLYRVTGTYQYGPQQAVSNFLFANMRGPIQGFTTAPTGVSGRTKYGIKGQPTLSWPDGAAYFIEGDDDSIRPVTLISLVATPMAGPDDCGDPPSSYPPKAPGPNDVKRNVNVNVGAGALIFAPVTLIPTRFNVNAQINPQINVSVGPFNVTFDAGGATVSPNFNFGNEPKVLPPTSSSPTIILPPQDAKKGTDCPDVTVNPTDLTPVITRLDTLKGLAEDIQDCACPIRFSTEVVNIGGPSRSGQGFLPGNTIRVNLNLVDIPINAKIQSGGPDAPTQYFCGYIAFGNGVAFGPRIPVNTARSTFEVPTWADTVYWSLYLGYTARVQRETLAPEKPNAELAVRQMKLKPS